MRFYTVYKNKRVIGPHCVADKNVFTSAQLGPNNTSLVMLNNEAIVIGKNCRNARWQLVLIDVQIISYVFTVGATGIQITFIVLLWFDRNIGSRRHIEETFLNSTFMVVFIYLYVTYFIVMDSFLFVYSIEAHKENVMISHLINTFQITIHTSKQK